VSASESASQYSVSPEWIRNDSEGIQKSTLPFRTESRKEAASEDELHGLSDEQLGL